MHFREVSGEAAGLNPEARLAAVEDYAALTGIVPEDAARRIGGDLLFGAPEIRLRAAQAVASLVKTDPHLRDLYPPELIALTERLKALESFGVPAD